MKMQLKYKYYLGRLRNEQKQTVNGRFGQENIEMKQSLSRVLFLSLKEPFLSFLETLSFIYLFMYLPLIFL